MSHKKAELEEIKKEIAIGRLRQAPLTVKVSLGGPGGDFMNRDQMIAEVNKNSEVGQRIITIQLEYLKAFKKGFSEEE